MITLGCETHLQVYLFEVLIDKIPQNITDFTHLLFSIEESPERHRTNIKS